jgi:hypothetical protein
LAQRVGDECPHLCVNRTHKGYPGQELPRTANKIDDKSKERPSLKNPRLGQRQTFSSVTARANRHSRIMAAVKAVSMAGETISLIEGHPRPSQRLRPGHRPADFWRTVRVNRSTLRHDSATGRGLSFSKLSNMLGTQKKGARCSAPPRTTNRPNGNYCMRWMASST